MVDDIERRLNVLFDALNCETLSRPVVDQLLTLVQGRLPRFFFSISIDPSSSHASTRRGGRNLHPCRLADSRFPHGRYWLVDVGREAVDYPDVGMG